MVLSARAGSLASLALALVVAGCAPRAAERIHPRLQTRAGAICRGPTDSNRLALVFTGHEFAEGAETILNELRSRNLPAAFFLTGDFLARQEFKPLVQRMVREGHYLGPHSDKHLLYCTWDNARTTLVSQDTFRSDLQENLKKLATAGVKSTPTLFLPPYEHNNLQIADWTRSMGLRLVNFTPGTRSAADYTGEADANFVSAQTILDSILSLDRSSREGLNGFILLLHAGAGPGRRDKMHTRLAELLDYLSQRGYECVRLDVLLKP